MNLNKYKFNPNLAVKDVLNQLKDKGVSLVEPTTPFALQTELNVTSGVNAITEYNSILRKLYPVLATTRGELNYHLAELDYEVGYSYGANATISLLVNVNDIKANGYKADVADNFVTISIPEYSTLTIAEYIFTLFNKVNLRYYDNGLVYVTKEPSTNNNTHGDKGEEVLKAAIITDNSNSRWIKVDIPAIQLERKHYSFTNSTDTFYIKKKFNNNLSKVDIIADTGKGVKLLNKTYNNIVYDPATPTAYVDIQGDEIAIAIPSIYTNNIISDIEVNIFTTNGAVSVLGDNYLIDDYLFTLYEKSSSFEVQAASKCNPIGYLATNCIGGRNQQNIDAIRDNIIYGATKVNNIPITFKELEEVADRDGFRLHTISNLITKRAILATRSITTSSTVAEQDSYMMDIQLLLSSYTDSDDIKLIDKNIVIKDNTMIKKGVFNRFMHKEEIDDFKIMSSRTKKETLNTYKYFYTPYLYNIVIDKEFSLYAYDLVNPYFTTSNTISKRVDKVEAYIAVKNIKRTSTGWAITIKLNGSPEFKKINTTKVKIAIKLNTVDGKTIDYYIPIDNEYVGALDITTNYKLITKKESLITITNGNITGESNLIPLDLVADVQIYTVDNQLTPSDYDLTNKVNDGISVNTQVISVTKLLGKLGIELKYLHNVIDVKYSNRKYVTYDTDIPLVYKQDVYKDYDGSILNLVDTNNDGKCDKVEYNLLHKKGDPVVDQSGNQVKEFKKGDIKLVDGKPVINYVDGISYIVTIPVLSYMYKAATDTAIAKHNNDKIKLLTSMINTTTGKLNTKLMENTVIYFTANKTLEPISVITDTRLNKLDKLPAIIEPIVNIYHTDASNIDMVNEIMLKNVIGNKLRQMLDNKKISLPVLEKELTDYLNSSMGANITSIKVKGIGIDYYIYNDINRASIARELTDMDNGSTVSFKMELNIVAI